ncbi:MAG: hypothetical protein EBZ48_02930 [Proteobacteria bacterium]|nr:hypothetical protein [Pseudomonadota bacterium]
MRGPLIRLVLLVIVLATPQWCDAQAGGKEFYNRDFAGSPLKGAAGAQSSRKAAAGASAVVGAARSVSSTAFDEVELQQAPLLDVEVPHAGESSANVQRGDGAQPSDVADASAAGQGGGIDAGADKDSADTRSADTRLAVESGSSSSARGRSSEVFGRGITIERLSLVTNGANEEHALEALTALREVIVDKELALGTVYLVGLNSSIKLDPLVLMVRRLQFLGAAFAQGLTEPPVPVKLSPTWIVETTQGRYLLEGTMNIDRFLNARGEFVKPGDEGLVPAAGQSSSVSSSVQEASAAGDGRSLVGRGQPQAARVPNRSSASSDRQGIVPEF